MSAGRPILVLVGPTAAGKTEAAIGVCEAVGGEVVSADSVQVYRGLDIGSAKPDAAERERAPHWCLDLADPDEGFDAARWAAAADAAIAEIAGRGLLPVVCGGTGLYVRALLHGLSAIPEIAAEVREEVAALIAEAGPAAAHRQLAVHDPRAAARIEPADRQRIGRALEVFRQTGRPISEWQEGHRFRPRRYEARVVGWWPGDRALLHRRIAARVPRMLEAGWVDEVRALLDAGVSADCPGLSTLGYREVVAHLRGALEASALPEAIAVSHRRYARRQLTWFRGVSRREDDLEHLDSSDPGARDRLVAAARATIGP